MDATLMAKEMTKVGTGECDHGLIGQESVEQSAASLHREIWS
jgi:hypothetical protein